MDTRTVAINYIKTLTPAEREHVRDMLSHSIICGADYARMNGVDPAAMTQELKRIFEVR